MIRSRARTLRRAAVGLLALLLLACAAGPLYAQPPDPGHGFYGTVKVNGRDAAVGTVIRALVDGVEYGNWTVNSPGQYALIVQGDIDEGATVEFYVGDHKADQTHPFHDGLTTALDLTAPGPPGGDDDDDDDDGIPPRPPWWPPGFPYFNDCFIATAAYGTPSAEQIGVLREFRDVVLLESAAGSLFVALYYRLSPRAAEVISRSGLLRDLVRGLVVDPVVGTVRATAHLWR